MRFMEPLGHAICILITPVMGQLSNCIMASRRVAVSSGRDEGKSDYNCALWRNCFLCAIVYATTRKLAVKSRRKSIEISICSIAQRLCKSFQERKTIIANDVQVGKTCSIQSTFYYYNAQSSRDAIVANKTYRLAS